MRDPYVDDVVAFFTHDGRILCPFCTYRNYNHIAVNLASIGKKNTESLHGLNRKILSEFMSVRFKDRDESQFYEESEFYPCDMCGGEIE